MAAPPRIQSLIARDDEHTHVSTMRMRTCEKIPGTTAAQESGAASRETARTPTLPTSSGKEGSSPSAPHEPSLRSVAGKDLHCEYIQQQRHPRRSGTRRIDFGPKRPTALPAERQQHLSTLR